MRALACLIFAILLPCRRSPTSFLRRTRTRWRSAREDGISHPAGDPKITAACQKVIETNNVEVDDRGLIYSADRAGTGMHIMRLTGHAKEIVAGK